MPSGMLAKPEPTSSRSLPARLVEMSLLTPISVPAVVISWDAPPAEMRSEALEKEVESVSIK